MSIKEKVVNAKESTWVTDGVSALKIKSIFYRVKLFLYISNIYEKCSKYLIGKRYKKCDWIPVEKVLPSDTSRKLITYEIRYFSGRIQKMICIAFYDDVAGKWYEICGFRIVNIEPPCYPTAWMDLPEFYGG